MERDDRISGMRQGASYPRATIDQFALEDEILYLCKRKSDETVLYLLVVPRELRKAALVLTHEKESAHLGQHKTILKTEELFYWSNLKKDVRQYVGECATCQQFKTARGLQQRWQELPPVDHPLERVSVEVTDMDGGAPGHRYVLTIIDHFSQFVNYHPLKARTSEQVVRRLDDFLDSYGSPKILLADNAR